MKIEQNPEFQPITITLETKEEAEEFLEVMSYHAKYSPSSDRGALSSKISDWFTTEAHL